MSIRRFVVSKAGLELTIAILIVLLFNMYSNFDVMIQRESAENWTNLVLRLPTSDDDYTTSPNLYTTNQAVRSIGHVVHTYFFLNESVDEYWYFNPSTGKIQEQPYDHLTMIRETLDGTEEEYELSPTDLGPLHYNSTALQNFFFDTQQLRIAFIVRQIQIKNSWRICTMWRETVTLDARQGGILYQSLVSESDYCHHELTGYTYYSAPVMISMTLCVLCAISVALDLRLWYLTRQSLADSSQTSAGSTTGRTGLQAPLLDGNERQSDVVYSPSPGKGADGRKDYTYNVWLNAAWLIVSVTGDLLMCVGCSLLIDVKINTNDLKSVAHASTHVIMYVLGSGAFLCSIRLCTRVRFFSADFTVLNRVVRSAGPVFVQIMIGMLPIFLGYALAGVFLFQNTSQAFIDFDTTLSSLFSMMQGDMLLDTFNDLSSFQYVFVSRLYMYSFVIIFVLMAAPVMLIFVEFYTHEHFGTPTDPYGLNTEQKPEILQVDNPLMGGVRVIKERLRLLKEKLENREGREQNKMYEVRRAADTKENKYATPTKQRKKYHRQDETKKVEENEGYTWLTPENAELNRKIHHVDVNADALATLTALHTEYLHKLTAAMDKRGLSEQAEAEVLRGALENVSHLG